MAELTLSESDHRLIKSVKTSFLEALGTESLMQRCVDTIAEALEGDCVTYQAIDGKGQIVGGVHYPADDDEGLHLIPVINKYLDENPLIPTLLGNYDSYRPVITTDFVELDDFKRTNLYQNAYKQLGWNYQMIAGLWDKSGVSHSMTINRVHKNFEERERLLYWHIFPAFLKAMKSNHLIGERLNQLRTNVKLTRRESETLHWVAEGKSNSEIAAILSLSNRTVDTHCARLFKKLGFENRAAAMKYASMMKRLTFKGGDDLPVLDIGPGGSRNES